MAEIVIKGGTVVDETGTRVADVAIDDSKIVAVGDSLDGERQLDASGCIVAPGLVDIHTHLREPGREEAETIESGSRAAVLGGFTAVMAMPNTTPAIDNAAIVRDVLQLGAKSLCDVAVAAAITIDRAGSQLAPMAEMAELGVHFFTDDGAGVQDAGLMRRAFEYASGLGVTLAQHCEVDDLSLGGAMNEGEWSSMLGLPGIPAEAEELMVMRDIALSRLAGAPVHFQHLSTSGSLAMVHAARESGMAVTAEVAPHHFTLTEAEVASYDPVFKVNPPLRTASDVAAVKAALKEGIVDAIATDHAPHSPDTKELSFADAPPGMLGLETALALAITELDLTPTEILALLSWQPARLAGLDSHGGPVAEGHVANLCVYDPETTWVVDGGQLASLSRNTPYDGRTLKGRVRHTLVVGEVVVQDGEPCR
jgi:dihydroorotase